MSCVTQLKISRYFNKHFIKDIYEETKSTWKTCRVTLGETQIETATKDQYAPVE